METVSENPFVFRPEFTLEERFLRSPREHEKRLLPFAMLPQMVSCDFSKEGKCSLVLDYLINETIGAKVKMGDQIMLDIGKFSGKVLVIAISYEDKEDFFHQLSLLQAYFSRKQSTGKNVVRHYFALLERLFGNIIADLKERNWLS